VAGFRAPGLNSRARTREIGADRRASSSIVGAMECHDTVTLLKKHAAATAISTALTTPRYANVHTKSFIRGIDDASWTSARFQMNTSAAPAGTPSPDVRA
jgi:hypothetical protein